MTSRGHKEKVLSAEEEMGKCPSGIRTFGVMVFLLAGATGCRRLELKSTGRAFDEGSLLRTPPLRTCFALGAIPRESLDRVC